MSTSAPAGGNGTAPRAARAAEAGHEVTWPPRARDAEEGAPALPREERIAGVRVHRVGATGLGWASLARRAADYPSFHALALARTASLPRMDAIVTLTSPAARRARGRDLAARARRPARRLAHGRLPGPRGRVRRDRRGRARRASGGPVARAALAGAAREIVLGRDMAEVARGAGRRRGGSRSAPNWADGARARPIPPGASALRRQLGLGAEEVVFGYSGNFGRGHRFEAVLEVARRRRADARALPRLRGARGPGRRAGRGRRAPLLAGPAPGRAPRPEQALRDPRGGAAGPPRGLAGERGRAHRARGGCGVVVHPDDADGLDGAVDAKAATGAVTVVPLLLVALPLADILWAMAGATCGPRPGLARMLVADRRHVHHRLIAIGLDQRQAI